MRSYLYIQNAIIIKPKLGSVILMKPTHSKYYPSATKQL